MIRLLRNQGMEQRYHNEVVGFNNRMTDIHAAIGRVQLGKLAGWTEQRRANAAYLNEQPPRCRDPAGGHGRQARLPPVHDPRPGRQGHLRGEAVRAGRRLRGLLPDPGAPAAVLRPGTGPAVRQRDSRRGGDSRCRCIRRCPTSDLETVVAAVNRSPASRRRTCVRRLIGLGRWGATMPACWGSSTGLNWSRAPTPAGDPLSVARQVAVYDQRRRIDRAWDRLRVVSVPTAFHHEMAMELAGRRPRTDREAAGRDQRESA